MATQKNTLNILVVESERTDWTHKLMFACLDKNYIFVSLSCLPTDMQSYYLLTENKPELNDYREKQATDQIKNAFRNMDYSIIFVDITQQRQIPLIKKYSGDNSKIVGIAQKPNETIPGADLTICPNEGRMASTYIDKIISSLL
ncbi:MAG: hypothetical protein ACP5N3_03785 [Candidatus Nanoarchaeia archaeon]